MADNNFGAGAGIPTDRFGGPTIDPTKNVLDLVEASNKRSDDLIKEIVVRLDSLRAVEFRRIDEVIKGEVLRAAQLRVADSKRTEDLALLRASHVAEIVKLQGEHFNALMKAESDRINAIRLVDVQAVQVASERAGAQAQVLATQVQQSAEINRSLVATTAQAQAAQLTQIIAPIGERIASLEKAQYETAGRSGIVDPQVAQMLSQMTKLSEAIAQGAGGAARGQQGFTNLISVIVAVVAVGGLLLTLLLRPDPSPAPVERVIERVVPALPEKPQN